MSSAAAPSIRHWQICGGNGANPISGGAHEAYTLLGTVDTTIELELDVGYCVIMKVGNTGDMQSAGDWQLQYEVNGAGGFVDVNASSSNVRSALTGDTEDATSTTERLGTSAETFQTSVLDEVEGLIGTNVGGHEEYEFYFAFTLRSADLTAGSETIELRLTTGGSDFDHTAVEPMDVTLPALPPNVQQEHYQFTTPITGAAHEAYTLVGSEDTSFEIELDVDYALIVKLGNDGAAAASQVWQLEYDVDGGGFNDVNASSSNVRSAASGDTDDATSATERLTNTARSFQTSKLDEVNGAITLAHNADSDIEYYFALNFRSAELSGGEEVTFRVTGATDTVTFDITPTATVPAAETELSAQGMVVIH